MRKAKLMLQVRKLRTKGKTYSEIQDILKTKIPKSTLSYWCCEIKPPAWYKQKLEKINKKHLKKIRTLAFIVNKKKRIDYLVSLTNRNMDILKTLDSKKQKLILSILYLAEGAKHKSSQTLSLANTNPAIIKFFITLLENCYNIDKSKYRVRVQCRFDQRTKPLEKFWQKVTGIKEKQFYPTYVDKRTKGKTTKKKNYMGVCTIHYFNTEIQLELELLANEVIKKLLKGR